MVLSETWMLSCCTGLTRLFMLQQLLLCHLMEFLWSAWWNFVSISFIGILFMDVRSSNGILNLCSSGDCGKPNMSSTSQHMETWGYSLTLLLVCVRLGYWAIFRCWFKQLQISEELLYRMNIQLASIFCLLFGNGAFWSLYIHLGLPCIMVDNFSWIIIWIRHACRRITKLARFSGLQCLMRSNMAG